MKAIKLIATIVCVVVILAAAVRGTMEYLNMDNHDVRLGAAILFIGIAAYIPVERLFPTNKQEK